jgi:AhpD family alkylhydroperoxidase
MNERYQLPKADPEGFKELLRPESYFDNIRWIKPILHPAKIRTSQINQCAYCINMHADKAVAGGESLKRIVLLNAWSEARCHSSKEKIALESPNVARSFIRQDSKKLCIKEPKPFHTDQEIAQVAMAIGLTNLWNRVVITAGVGKS